MLYLNTRITMLWFRHWLVVTMVRDSRVTITMLGLYASWCDFKSVQGQNFWHSVYFRCRGYLKRRANSLRGCLSWPSPDEISGFWWVQSFAFCLYRIELLEFSFVSLTFLRYSTSLGYANLTSARPRLNFEVFFREMDTSFVPVCAV